MELQLPSRTQPRQGVPNSSNTVHAPDTNEPGQQSFELPEADAGTGAATARITSIETSATEEDLTNFLESKELSLSEDHSQIRFTTSDERFKLTTVSFVDEKTLKRALSLPRIDRKLKKRTLNFDVGFDGFTVLSEGTEVE